MADLSLIIRALFEGSDQIESAKEGVQGVADAAGELETNAGNAEQPVLDFGGALTGALGMAATIAIGVKAVAEGISMVIDAAKEAAELDFVTMQFDNLALSIGETSEALMVDMRAATQGLISDAELQSGASMLISSGYAKTSEEVANLAGLAVDLNVPFTDMTKLIGGTGSSLKNLGVDISGINDRVNELVEDGWTKQAAQVIANTEAIENHVETVGSAADSEMALFKKLDVAKANSATATNELTSASGRLFAEIGLQAHQVYQTELAYADLRSELVKNNIAFDEEMAVFQSWTSNAEEKNAALESMAIKLYGAEYALSRFSAAEIEMIGKTFDATSSYQGFIVAAEKAGLNVNGITEAVYAEMLAIVELNNTPLDDKEADLTVDDQASGVIDDVNATVLDDKTALIDFELDTSAVDGYRPPNKYGAVIYQTNTVGANAVGGAVYGGNPYTWQEYGYKGELFVPSSNGFVMSRADAERALSKALTTGGGSVDPEAIGKAVAKALSGVTKDNQKGGNVYNLTMPTSSNPADVRTAFELMEAWA